MSLLINQSNRSVANSIRWKYQRDQKLHYSRDSLIHKIFSFPSNSRVFFFPFSAQYRKRAPSRAKKSRTHFFRDCKRTRSRKRRLFLYNFTIRPLFLPGRIYANGIFVAFSLGQLTIMRVIRVTENRFVVASTCYHPCDLDQVQIVDRTSCFFFYITLLANTRLYKKLDLSSMRILKAKVLFFIYFLYILSYENIEYKYSILLFFFKKQLIEIIL